LRQAVGRGTLGTAGVLQVAPSRIGNSNDIFPARVALGGKLTFRISQARFRIAKLQRDVGFIPGAGFEVGLRQGSGAAARNQFIVKCLLGSLSVACPGCRGGWHEALGKFARAHGTQVSRSTFDGRGCCSVSAAGFLASRVRVPPPHLDLGFGLDRLICASPRFLEPEPNGRERFAETISRGTPRINVAAEPLDMLGSSRGRGRAPFGVCEGYSSHGR
jgi:hypothetical protein